MVQFFKSLLFISSILFFGAAYSYTLPDGSDEESSGFGGTGHGSSGFGGTGHSSSGFGGTGIIGTITDFGSIWVNGVEIGYGDATKIISPLQQEQLKIGQQVILETLPREDKTLTRSIRVYYPVAGKITAIEGSIITIDQQYRIQRTEQTKFDTGMQLRLGEFVAINAYPTENQTWIATRMNTNSRQLKQYQPIPELAFGVETQNVLMDLTRQQVEALGFKLDAVSDAVKGYKAQDRIMVKGKFDQRDNLSRKVIEVTEVMPFNQARHRLEENNRSNTEKLDSEKMQQQMQMMQQQREQKQMIQNQIEQQRQLQELKNQMDQIQSMKNQMNKPF